MITISRDIVGVDYSMLLKRARERYPSLSLVWADQFEFQPSARQIQDELHPFELSRAHTDRWPGTILLGHFADVVHYGTRAIDTGVLDRAKSLFGWLAPELPEDLAFYRADGSCAIESIAHENDARFHDDDWLTLLPVSVEPVLQTTQST